MLWLSISDDDDDYDYAYDDDEDVCVAFMLRFIMEGSGRPMFMCFCISSNQVC